MPFVTGYEEDGFLKSLNLSLSDIEPRAKGCSQVGLICVCIEFLLIKKKYSICYDFSLSILDFSLAH
jgi:hypothetical protein